MTRHVLVTESAASVSHYDWDERSTIRISWDVPGDTRIELPHAPDGVTQYASLADIRGFVAHREAKLAKFRAPLSAKELDTLADYLVDCARAKESQ